MTGDDRNTDAVWEMWTDDEDEYKYEYIYLFTLMIRKTEKH